MKPAHRKKAKPKRKNASAAPRRRYTLSQVTEFLMLDQLPSDADDSDADIDEEDRDELNQLNSTAGSCSASRSASALPPNDILQASAAEDAAKSRIMTQVTVTMMVKVKVYGEIL